MDREEFKQRFLQAQMNPIYFYIYMRKNKKPEENVVRFVMKQYDWSPIGTITSAETIGIDDIHRTEVNYFEVESSNKCFGFEVYINGELQGSVITYPGIYQFQGYTLTESGQFIFDNKRVVCCGQGTEIENHYRYIEGFFPTGRDTTYKRYNKDKEQLYDIKFYNTKVSSWGLKLVNERNVEYISMRMYGQYEYDYKYQNEEMTHSLLGFQTDGENGMSRWRTSSCVDGASYSTESGTIPYFIYAFNGWEYNDFLSFMRDLSFSDKYTSYTKKFDIDDDIIVEEPKEGEE